jgi:sterol desaturase/sphingolipid hydroxylase (fatty acid hydroxylase superfamily)
MAFGIVFMWIPGWFITRDGVFLAGLITGSVLLSNLFIVVHDTIHRPGSHRILEAQPWFPFLDNHHYVHHVALGCNLNFLLPLGDLLFGTLRLHLTEEELRAHGSLARAKLLRVGEGERAHR